MFADDRTFYLFTYPGETSYTTKWSPFWFGDFYSISKETDNYKCMVYGSTGETTTESTFVGGLTVMQNSNWQGLGIARSYSGYTSGIRGVKTSLYYLGGNNDYFRGDYPLPNPVNESMYISPVIISEVSATNTIAWPIRGRFRGLYFPCHANTQFNDGQLIFGSGEYSGKIFFCLPLYWSSIVAVEISNTLETNTN
jgi:hypothetical protein